MTDKSKIRTNAGYVLNVAWAAHRGAVQDTAAKAEEFVGRLMSPGTFLMTDRQPDIILFMSGGSERRAIELAEPGRPVLLLSIRGNNAYAAATEVMAWMVNNNRVAVLSDSDDALESGLINRWRTVAGAWRLLEGSRAGLIGTVSEWLVASDVPAETLRRLLGTELISVPWSGLPDYSREDPDKLLLNRFAGQNADGLEDAAQVLTVLRRAMHNNGLDAIAVECFSLVQERRVTACIALAQLNTEGTVATCEGDLASMAGMMAGRALTGRVPWMANTTRLSEKSVVLSHCTAPFDLVSAVKLPTHYETGYSLAVDGDITPQDVTVFRFSEKLDRVFIAEGRVLSKPHMADACRTQVEIELSSEAVQALREKPLGNHLLMLPGKHADLLRLACIFKGIEQVKGGEL